MTKARDLANSAAAFASVSATELGYVDGVTSAIQTQMDAKAPSSTAVTLTGTQTLTNKTLTSPVIASVINNTLTSTTGDIIYASGANTPARLGIGSSAQVLTVASGIPSWATPATAASGLTLISRATVTNAANTSTTFDGVFSNTYNAYQIIIESAFALSGSCALKFNWRNGGSSLVNAEYYGMTNLMDLSSTVTSVGQIGTTFMTLIAQTGSTLASSSGLNLTAKMVRTTQTPTIFGVVTGNNASGTGVCGTKFNSATNADGFILSVATGNITCTVAVYGLAAA